MRSLLTSRPSLHAARHSPANRLAPLVSRITHCGLLTLATALASAQQTPSAESSAPSNSTPTPPPPPAIAPAPKPAPVPTAPPAQGLEIVRLAGANGREVDFAGVWEARPEGLIVVTDATAPLQLVAWDRFDLARLRAEQPAIDAARQRAQFLGTPQSINLGLFAGLLTPAQAGTELRRLLDTPTTIKVPERYRSTTTTSTATSIRAPMPVIYEGIILPPAPGTGPTTTQTTKTVTEVRRVTPDELSTSARRIFHILATSDKIAAEDRRDLLELVRFNPQLLENTAAGLERVSTSWPPSRLLPNDPTYASLAARLRELAATLRACTTARTLNYSDQIAMRDIIGLADHTALR